MDKVAKDYKFFRDHFYPEKKPESTPAEKSCPTCGSKIYKIVEEKRICDRCGKVWKVT
jgi:CRISPR/Cas system-associated protein Cas10 (large subunit of type III CRISPR-Cas system)